MAVISDDGKQLGVMSLSSALALALERELDLVEVSPNLNPPVCKIMDYGKFIYKIEKQKRQQSAKQKRVGTKGIRLSVRIDKHDLEFKARNAIKFMEKGHKAKIDMFLKGREKANIDFARNKIESFIQSIKDMMKADPKTANREIITEKGLQKTPHGFTITMELKQ